MTDRRKRQNPGLSVIVSPVLIIVSLNLFAQEQPDCTISRKGSLNAYPYAFYTPETELAFGGGGILTFYTANDADLRPSKMTLSGYYSTKGQYQFTVGPEVYFDVNKYFISASLDFGRYVDRFYGIGNDTPDIDNVDFDSRVFGADLNFQLPSLFHLSYRSGIIYDFSYNDVIDKKDNPYLLSGNIRGSEGGFASGLGLIWVYDTRDHIFFPNNGGFHQVKAVFYSDAIGSDFDFNKYELDVRRYIAVAPDHVFAFQIYGSMVRGSPPFYELPALGGQNRMRGFYQGRFRDKNYLTGQVEYRAYLWWRIGMVAFIGIGDVSEGVHDFRLRNFKSSYGFGVRFKFNEAEKVNLRMDLGFGKGTSGIYFGIEEVF
ncbi:MAG: BamA/TamA family outer membrane protein [Verrucomicrobia bacterium]|nr:BamA/TamA family outer membrane protein [Verrucomicrobiota bacterium]